MGTTYGLGASQPILQNDGVSAAPMITVVGKNAFSACLVSIMIAFDEIYATRGNGILHPSKHITQ